MIMAGRGRRLGDLVEQSKKVGSSDTLVDEPASDIQTLTKYINEINLTKVSSTLLNVIQTSFKQMFTTGDSLQNVISELHCKALSDVNFGEKLAISLQQFFCAQVDGSSFRKAIFDLMQSEFNQKDTISQSNKTRFFNSVMLLGNFYRIMTIEGDPVHVLGSALLEYCEMLLKGNEEELELLATQVNTTFLIQCSDFCLHLFVVNGMTWEYEV